ncbi:MAG: hypothetical protein JW822_07850 [Spirochaetales bacterium]|nr:hypothetical protein [Spirochaetales bacterium]
MVKFIKSNILLFLIALCLYLSGCFQTDGSAGRLTIPKQLKGSEIVLYAKVKNLIYFGLMGSGGVVFSLYKTVQGSFEQAEFGIKFQYLAGNKCTELEKGDISQKIERMYTFKIGEMYILGLSENHGCCRLAYIPDTKWELDDFTEYSP